MKQDFIDFLEDLENRINTGVSTDDIKTLIGQKIKKIQRSDKAKTVRQNEQTQEVCPECENPYPHISKQGTVSCEECGYNIAN